MSGTIESRREQAILEALGLIPQILGKEQEFNSFLEYIMYVETPAAVQSLDGIAAQTPEWIQLITRPIGRLYDIAYVNGVTDAGL
jgi:hypothetical protein